MSFVPTLDNWLTCSTSKADAALRLFVFPYAGAGTAVFRGWDSALSAQVEMNVIRLPGRETRLRETPFTAMPPLITALADALLSALDKPFLFYGHSMGGLVAFELTRELRRRGLPTPLHLLVSARRAPQLADPDLPLHALSDAAFVKEMQRRYDGIPAAILNSPDLLALFVPALKADFAVIETYAYQPAAPFDLPITAFGGTHDHVLRAGDLEGWAEQTTGAFAMQKFVGGHFFIQSQQTAFLSAVNRVITRYL
jgi:medium-chain acyl-[acyl-carrier-protein] hydrolase